MKIITLEEKDFDKFASKHKYRNFYQTSNYAKVMENEGYKYHYLGFLNNSNELIGATLLLYKEVWMNYKYAYAPYGFLVDYTNNDIIEELTTKLKKLLLKQRFIYVKINPFIHCVERKKDNQILSYNPEINNILEILKNNGYIHHGFNKFFENVKPRWNAIVKLTTTNDKIYYSLDKQIRNKINKANRNGIDIIKATHNDLPILYEFIKRKHDKSLDYYKNILENYKDDAEIYFAYINPKKYVEETRKYYSKELNNNDELNEKLKDKSKYNKNIDKLINTKMESDKRLGIYQRELLNATNIFQITNEGIIIGGALVIKYDKGVNLLIEGFDKKYSSFNSNFKLKWELIKQFNNEGYRYFNLNGITGEFEEKNKYSGLNEMKLGFNACAIEYIGEFDLIINKTVFSIYKRKLKKESKEI